jgi:hypothetical protein
MAVPGVPWLPMRCGPGAGGGSGAPLARGTPSGDWVVDLGGAATPFRGGDELESVAPSVVVGGGGFDATLEDARSWSRSDMD